MTSVEEFNCILCKETFDNKDELQIHFRKHGDPKFNESIKTKNRVQNEAPFANEKSNDASEMVNCDVCDEVFPTISKAITHKHKVHPEHDAKYFCPWCGKLFTMKHLYNKHLHTNHDTPEEVLENKDTHFHCDSCNVSFFIPSAMVYHNKFFHRQDSDLPIIGHSKKQKLIIQDLLPVYYCSFCGEEYINKVNLHKHMCDDHGDENQRPTDVLRCPLCEAIFYHLDAYELHLTFHSSEDLYSETNEMNEKETLEFSLETVAPVMERIEDLNTLPDSETDTNPVGIESFLQMNMDEPNHGNQLSEKARKKHKKHKKSKKPAITLDEFLSMNQDVFGEDLDFQGIEEVPTKVITKQLKIRKPPIQKYASKAVSSADLQKLKKLGIAVKVQSGNKPAIRQVSPIRQPIKINPEVRNLATPTKTNVISTSNEVLSKLLNQSSSQLKIVKKSAQEKEPSDEPHASESPTECPTEENKTVSEDIKTNSDKKDENGDDDKPKLTQVHVPQSPTRNQENALKDTFKTINHINDETANKQPAIVDTFVNNDTCTKQIKTSIFNQNVSAEKCISGTLKNIGKHITIKPVSQPVSRIDEVNPHKLALPEVNDAYVEPDPINKNNELNEKHEAQEQNKTISSLKKINSAITIKTLQNSSATGRNKNNTNNNDKTDKIIKPGTLRNLETSPIQQSKLETTVEQVDTNEKLKEESIVMESPSQVLRNISKNITIKSMSPQVKYRKITVTNDQHNDSNSDNDDNDYVSMEKQDSNSVVGSVPERFSNLNSSLKLNANVRTMTTPPCANKKAVVNVNKNLTEKETYVMDNTNIESSSNILKHLTNITAKPVTTSKSISRTIKTQTNSNILNVAKEGNTIRKTIQTKEMAQDIEIFNIDDSDDEEQPNKPILDVARVKKEPIHADVNSHKVLNAIKNMSKHIIVKPNVQTTLTKNVETDENYSDFDEMHDDGDYDSNDDFEQCPTATVTDKMAPTQQDNKNDPFNNVLRHLGKHITVKSRNVSPNQSVKSSNQTVQTFNQVTTANDGDSDEDSYPSKVKITEVTEEDNIDHTNNCFNEGIVTQCPEDSFSGDEQFREDIKEVDEQSQKLNARLNQNVKNSNESLLKNISKNITVKSVNEKTNDTESNETVLPENEPKVNQTTFSKELIRPFKKNNVTTYNEKTGSSNLTNNKRMDGTTISNPITPNVHSKLANPGVSNSVNKEVKVKTFQSETVIEEITTTVTKTIRRVNQTVTNQQVFNASQTSTAPRIIKPTGPRLAGIHNNLKGVTVRQANPVAVRPKCRQPAPFRPVSSTVVRPSNQLVPIRPGVSPIRTNNAPRMQIKNMPRQQRPVGKPLKISPNVVNQTLKRPVNEEQPGHFSCFKKPKESLIPGNENTLEPRSNIQFAASSQMKFCSTTQTVKGNSVVTSTQTKSESLSQQQQINRLGNISGLKVAKASHVTKVEKTETNTSNRTTLAAIEKLQKQGLLIKKPRIEDFDPSNSDEDNEQFNDYDE